MCNIAGRAKEMVFPLPVWAMATTSLPLKAIGHAWHWIGVGLGKPWARMVLIIYSGNPISSKEVTGRGTLWPWTYESSLVQLAKTRRENSPSSPYFFWIPQLLCHYEQKHACLPHKNFSRIAPAWSSSNLLHAIHHRGYPFYHRDHVRLPIHHHHRNLRRRNLHRSRRRSSKWHHEQNTKFFFVWANSP